MKSKKEFDTNLFYCFRQNCVFTSKVYMNMKLIIFFVFIKNKLFYEQKDIFFISFIRIYSNVHLKITKAL